MPPDPASLTRPIQGAGLWQPTNRSISSPNAQLTIHFDGLSPLLNSDVAAQNGRGRETLGLIGSAVYPNAHDTGLPEAALSISPFERSRWRLRRTRQAMAKAARFRRLFGWMAEADR